LNCEEKKKLIKPAADKIPLCRKCELLGLAKSTYYYKPKTVNEYALKLMREIDKEFTRHPFYGTRRLKDHLCGLGYEVGRDKIRSLMILMGIEAIYPKPHLSAANKEHKVYPYLLGNMDITRVDQVWTSDITYIPMQGSFAYLAVVMDWFSRYVLAWELSMSLDSGFCISALESALMKSTPEVFNTDQGSQYTSHGFTEVLKSHGVKISMDGKGRAFDNIIQERLWRTVKYEEVYLKEYENYFHAIEELKEYFDFYNNERRHSSLEKQRPAEVYFNGREAKLGAA